MPVPVPVVGFGSSTPSASHKDKTAITFWRLALGVMSGAVEVCSSDTQCCVGAPGMLALQMLTATNPVPPQIMGKMPPAGLQQAVKIVRAVHARFDGGAKMATSREHSDEGQAGPLDAPVGIKLTDAESPADYLLLMDVALHVCNGCGFVRTVKDTAPLVAHFMQEMCEQVRVLSDPLNHLPSSLPLELNPGHQERTVALEGLFRSVSQLGMVVSAHQLAIPAAQAKPQADSEAQTVSKPQSVPVLVSKRKFKARKEAGGGSCFDISNLSDSPASGTRRSLRESRRSCQRTLAKKTKPVRRVLEMLV
ncbi:MAG: hypothetical protein WDW38_006643 [Sanguina aurantia]